MQPSVERIPIGQILADARFQPRGDGRGEAAVVAAELDRMAQAAQDAGYPTGWHPGLYDLIHVWPDPDQLQQVDRFYVLKGFHRRALAIRCGIEALDCVVHWEADEAEARRLADRSNSDTRPMDPVAEAEVIRRAFEEGLTVDQVARRFDRRTPGYYDRRVTLAYLCENLKLDVRQKTLGVDYAEAIGSAAREGATPTMQRLLADLARRTKVRPDLFRRMVAVILRRAKQKTGEIEADPFQGVLFDLSAFTDNAAEALTGVLAAASKAAAIRDGWAEIRQAIKSQLRRIERAGGQPPEVLAKLAAEVDGQVSQADRDVGAAMGETEDMGEDRGATGVREARPLLKWVGGKGRESSILLPYLRDRVGGGRYIEPFLGGGAMYFALSPDRAVLNDALPDLIALYRSVAADPVEVHRALAALSPLNTPEGFAAVRADYNAAHRADATPDAIQAARLIFLNRTGFNGLHRTNKAGHFNVPFGKFAAPAFPTLADLERAATLLRGADLHCGDWKAHVDLAGAGDLVFLDPPYPGTFQGYATAERPVDLLELVRTAKAAWQRGAGVVCTLPDTEEIQAHFEGWCAREPLTRRTGVAAVASARGALSQAAFISIKH